MVYRIPHIAVAYRTSTVNKLQFNAGVNPGVSTNFAANSGLNTPGIRNSESESRDDTTTSPDSSYKVHNFAGLQQIIPQGSDNYQNLQVNLANNQVAGRQVTGGQFGGTVVVR